MCGVRQLQVALLRPVPAVLDVVGEGLLAGIDVDRGDFVALIEEVDREMEAGGGLARPALSFPMTMTCVPVRPKAGLRMSPAKPAAKL